MIGCRAFNGEENKRMIEALYYERDRLLFILGVNTGFRISELLSLTRHNVHNGFITVERKNMKGKLCSRSVPLSESILGLLKTYIESLPESQMTLFPIGRMQAWRIIKRAAKKSNVSGKIGTHSMRKTLASRVYAASNRDLAITQKALGHKNVSSTISYLQVDADAVNAIILNVQGGE
jgi:integrase